ncbi:MAG: hypothetical protein ABDH32_00455 [Candidatus Caldarchaeales archaeon]
MSNLRDVIVKTIQEFNKYRRSVAEAELIEIKDDEVVLKISGSLCHTCGFIDYLEDFIYEMERLTDDYRVNLTGYQVLGDDEFLVKYRVEEKKVERK